MAWLEHHGFWDKTGAAAALQTLHNSCSNVFSSVLYTPVGLPGMDRTHLTFCAERKDKGPICQRCAAAFLYVSSLEEQRWCVHRLGVNVFIDDSPEVLLHLDTSLAAAVPTGGPLLLLFSERNKPYAAFGGKQRKGGKEASKRKEGGSRYDRQKAHLLRQRHTVCCLGWQEVLRVFGKTCNDGALPVATAK